ncbi:amino acid adenylation domain-containing protein/non-ribosomal peptide synthase protein (TIGR01720 family) [Clostridium punense]|uniref:Amino acid adenylation domain-containing protein/non-ribosomal peptide synthase protein (TIGR01720 family) n=1 Tax=Clostridium punense TaxID=1054297 RepID=A0ABS4K3X9_9CLOT|nr:MULTISPECIES: non-ribosomal peptide synthetase [Clostridium]EQB86567.1 peptide synthetase [Clostridium sp. BL8]MBP2022487.1 amino acid adenylation domain-containing protein/non-ribosomal peptide synthase protein (TIGR01720 family) [Clostridium punense]
MRNSKRVYYKLTHPQKRIWYIDKINTNSPLHNIGGCLSIYETIDVEVMKETLNLIIKNNEGLRLRVSEKENETFQYVKEFQNEDIDFLDFSSYENPQKEYETWSNELFKKCFNLENSKLYYFAIYKISEKEYGVLLNIHHIIADGWSITLIQKQICEIYRRLMNKEDVYMVNYSYLDFIKAEEEYLNSERFIKNKNFWKDKFSSVPEEFLYKTSDSLEGKRQCFNLDEELSNKIRKFADDKKCSLNTLFITILLIYINKVTYKKDLVVGTPVFNRTNKDQKNMMGMFTSTVPVRFKLDTELKIENLINLVNRELKLCFLNQKYPYDLLIKELNLMKDGYDSLFKMCVNYYNSKYDSDINGVDVKVKEYYCGNQSYSLQLTVKEWDESNITLNFDYKTSEYSDNEMKTMYEAMINIANQIVMDENIVVIDLKLMNKEESNYKVHDLNSTTSCYPQKTVCELFEEQVFKTPNKIALEFKDNTLTYKKLNEKCNQLANHLRETGIGKTSIVAIMETHSIELLVSILGVLKAGAAYVPIDPSYPIERINYMLEDSKSTILLTNFKIADEIKFKGNIININNEDLQGYNKNNLPKSNGLMDLVYIIYTSGSTGKPKGVMIEHQGLTNYILWSNKMYLKNEEEAMPLYSSISFDLTVTSIFTPLISGNKIVIYDNDETEFVLYKILRENKATVVKLTPAHLTLLKDMDNTKSSIKRFIVGGEDLKANLAKEVCNSFGKNIEIFNEYGPTETVVGCMIYKYDEEKVKSISVPIGYPADNVQIYILDNELNPVLTGFIGELYISGDGVARGYLNREDLTHERFIENPFIKGKRMYKTGDTARYIENGAIEYVGRIDNQVKIRGHRIELGEIERYLMENQSIKDAVVVFKEDSLGNKILNTYVVRKKEITDSELKEWLLKFLPKYMIPTNFVFIEKIPLTLNGKVNYALLPEPEIVEKEFIKYETLAEKELVKAMEEILGVENISMNDNYYQLGGDSIKAIQISSKLKNLGFNIKVKDILAHDFIEEIAATIEESKAVKSIRQDKIEGIVGRTPIIEWFFNQKFSNENLYNQHVLLEYKGKLDINKVISAVNKLIEHHDALRINYDRRSNDLYYNNKKFNEMYAFKYLNLSQYSYKEQCNNIKKLIEETNSSINIENNSLFNVVMMDLDEDRQALLFIAHHLIVDGVSWRVILDDFITILKQLDEDSELRLPLKTNSYKEWAEALQTYSKNDFSDEVDYWKAILNKEINYNVDYDNEEDIVETSNILSKEIDEKTLNSLVEKSKEIYNIDLNETLIIGLVIALNKLTNKDEIIVELERHGREAINDYIDISRTVGWFTSMYPAHFSIEHEDIEDSIKSLKEQLKNIPNKGFNYSILKFLNKALKEQEIKYVRFNYLGDFDNIIDKEKLNLSNIEFGLDSDKDNSLTALIDIAVMIVNKKLKITIEYSKKRFKYETIEKFIESYIEILNLILDKCSNKDFKQFTPSDFDAVDISQEDLDALFD